MPIFSTELPEVAPKQPQVNIAVGAYVVAVGLNTSTSGLMPNGAFSVMDTTPETARAFTGLNASTSPPTPFQSGAGCAYGGYAWVSSPGGNTLYRIDPATGGVTSIAMGSVFAYNAVARVSTAGGYICVFSSGLETTRLYRVSTAAVSTVTTTGLTGTVGTASDGTYVYAHTIISGVTGIRRFDPSAGTFTLIGTTTGSVPANQGVVHAGSVWYAASDIVLAVNLTTGIQTSYSHTGVAGGNYSSATDLVLHDDGYMYGYGSASDVLIVFDPATGAFVKETLSPTRGRRYSPVSCGGKLWIPSGEPLT